MTYAIQESLLDLIYDSASDPAMLDDVLASLCELTHSDGALLEGFSHRHRFSSFHHSVGLDPSLKVVHEAFHIRNPWADYMVRQPVGRVVMSDEVIRTEKLVKTAFYADIIHPQKLGQSAMSVLAARPDFTVGYHAMRTVSHGNHDQQDIAILKAILPHLRRSLELRLRVENYAALAKAEMDALDLLASGVILLSKSRRVVFVNRSAEAFIAQIPSVVRTTPERGVTGGSSDEAVKLQIMVDDVISGGAGGMVRLSGPNERWLNVSVAPLRSRTSTQLRSVGLTKPEVALFISDPSQARSPNASFLCDHYGLTPMEAKVALLMGTGTALSDAANALGISLNTLKTHARRIYQKTGVRGQPDLQQLMNALVPVNTPRNALPR